MDGYLHIIPKNCNDCAYKQMVSRHWELEDYCMLNKKKIREIVMDEDCPLGKTEER